MSRTILRLWHGLVGHRWEEPMVLPLLDKPGFSYKYLFWCSCGAKREEFYVYKEEKGGNSSV